MDIKEKLLNAFRLKQYEEYCSLFGDYLKNGYGIEYSTLTRYIWSLINLKRWDEALPMIKHIESTTNHPEINYDLICMYIQCCKSSDAERVYNRGNANVKSKDIIVKMYLHQGKVAKAKEMARSFLQEGFDPDVSYFLNQIYNHEDRKSFIYTDYESFAKSGNKLECGHSVYLKEPPISLDSIEEDPKINIRPYFVWKVEGNKVFLFPFTTQIKEKNYVLLKKNYPNINRDRTIRASLCYTTLDNILSVQDKILPEDIEPLLNSVFRAIYFAKTRDKRQNNGDFLKDYRHDVKENSVIRTIDAISKDNRYYFVIDIKDDCYTVIEVNRYWDVVANKTESYRKDRAIYQVLNISSLEIDYIKKQIPPHLLVKSYIGARVETEFGKYIVVRDTDDYCIGISDLYSPHYIQLDYFKKDRILKENGNVDSKELQEIRGLIDRNCKGREGLLLSRIKAK